MKVCKLHFKSEPKDKEMQDYFQDTTVGNNVMPKVDAEYIGVCRRYIRFYSSPQEWLTDNLKCMQPVSPSLWFLWNGMTDKTTWKYI